MEKIFVSSFVIHRYQCFRVALFIPRFLIDASTIIIYNFTGIINYYSYRLINNKDI